MRSGGSISSPRQEAKTPPWARWRITKPRPVRPQRLSTPAAGDRLPWVVRAERGAAPFAGSVDPGSADGFHVRPLAVGARHGSIADSNPDHRSCGEERQDKHQQTIPTPSPGRGKDGYMSSGFAKKSRAYDTQVAPPAPNEIVPEHPQHLVSAETNDRQPTLLRAAAVILFTDAGGWARIASEGKSSHPRLDEGQSSLAP